MDSLMVKVACPQSAERCHEKWRHFWFRSSPEAACGALFLDLSTPKCPHVAARHHRDATSQCHR